MYFVLLNISIWNLRRIYVSDYIYFLCRTLINLSICYAHELSEMNLSINFLCLLFLINFCCGSSFLADAGSISRDLYLLIYFYVLINAFRCRLLQVSPVRDVKLSRKLALLFIYIYLFICFLCMRVVIVFKFFAEY